MISTRRNNRRPASIIPALAVSLVALFGFLALAVDLGLLMAAKTHAQNAADSAAMTGARTLDGSSTGNIAKATTNAQNIAALNTVLGDPVLAGEVTVTHGTYHYDTTNQVFVPQFPPVAPDNYNLTQVTITPNRPSPFAGIFGVTSLKVNATAIAAHRPRDIAIVLDYSGSMNNESDLWVVEPEYGASNYDKSNNDDLVYPQFGPYDPTFSPLAALLNTSADPRVGRSNVTFPALGIPKLVDDFYQNGRGASAILAFNPAPNNVTNTKPGGDKYLSMDDANTTAKNWSEIVGDDSTAFKGYPNFKGYTQGPGYWGMTFFIWPPDPNTPDDNASPPVPGDWRKRFFFNAGGSYPNFGGPLNDNTKLWNSSGKWRNPSGNYVINYKAILAWINANCVQSSPMDSKPFPPTLRAGRILYYNQIPSDVPASAYTHSTNNTAIAWPDQNQRFWKEYIDWTLGVWSDPFGNIQNPPAPACSMGGDFTCGSATNGQYVQISGPDQPDPSGRSYIDALDNPLRPRHRMWFGPMTMVQFMSDTGLFPGTTHDISMYSAKVGIQGAMQDIQNNHPNDLVSLILFSRPVINATGPGGPVDPPGVGAFNQAAFPLTRNYASLIDGLYYPPNSGTSDVLPWDANGVSTPRAHGDYCANTATGYGLMLAYNQFSGTSYSGSLAGNGRKGASRLVVLETDGMANVSTGANFFPSVSGTTNNSYYEIGPTDQVWLDNIPAGQSAKDVATRLCALTTDMVNGPGFATLNKPVLIHVLVFGAVFEVVASPPAQQSQAFTLCQQLSAIGGTGFPSSITNTSDPNYYKICTGTQTQRADKLKQAFINIMDSNIPVSLIR